MCGDHPAEQGKVGVGNFVLKVHSWKLRRYTLIAQEHEFFDRIPESHDTGEIPVVEIVQVLYRRDVPSPVFDI